MSTMLIAVPTFENVNTETFESIYNLKIPGGVNSNLKFIKGYDCAKARNRIAKISQNEKYDYVFMVDSDVVLPENALLELFKFFDTFSGMIIGYYPRKNEPDQSEVYKNGWGYPIENRMSIEHLKQSKADLIRIQGGGLGCALIRVSVFDQLDYPYFKYIEYPDGEGLSEDLYFCEELVKRNIPIYVNPKVGCGHVKKRIIEC